MKRYQILERCMQDYPAGTVARFRSAPNVDHISDGKFSFQNLNNNGKLHVLGGKNSYCFYSDGEFAIPVKPSILEGKVAIQVNNEREFKLLMEHYTAKGWRTISSRSANDNDLTFDYCFSDKRDIKAISYGNEFCFPHNTQVDDRDENLRLLAYKIIPFADFAKEVGIATPVFMMKSEEYVDLYKGDAIWTSRATRGGIGHCVWNPPLSKILTPDVLNELTLNRENIKAFSTAKIAELWIADQNKPKVLTIHYDSNNKAVITKDRVIIHLSDASRFELSGLLFDDTYKAYKSLQ